MKVVLIFIISALFFIELATANVYRAQQCGQRKIFDPCPSICTNICRYGAHKDKPCVSMGVCSPKCICASQYVLDPKSNECWTKSYCLYRRKLTFIKGIFGKTY